MRKLFAIAVAAALLVGVTVVPILARGKAAEKATGSVELDIVPPDSDTRHASFNAHEAIGNRPAKGKFSWTQTRPGVTYWFLVDIENVLVDGNEARFDGVVVAANDVTSYRIGQQLFVHVVDNATPGAGGDELDCHWVIDGEVKPTYYYNVIAGNLVVHTYGD